jgi:hypothetical protein
MKRPITALALAGLLAACSSPAGDAPTTTTADIYREGEEALEQAQTTATTTALDPSQTCDQIGHPYPAKPGDPHDGDQDGLACEEG